MVLDPCIRETLTVGLPMNPSNGGDWWGCGGDDESMIKRWK